MAVNIKVCMDKFKKINNRWNFQLENPFFPNYLLWFVLAYCVAIFPIGCDLSDFLYSQVLY